jgi:hypothetical protein
MPRRALALALLALAAGCGSTASPAAPGTASSEPTGTTVLSVAVSGSGNFTMVGQTGQLSAIASIGSLQTQTVTSTATWQSSNPSVATVSASGLVTTVGLGAAVISATYQGKTGTLAVRVAAASNQIAVCGIYSGPGPFTVAGDIIAGSNNCIRFVGNVGGALDCEGHDVSSIGLVTVQGFSIRNCVMHAGANQTLRIANSRAVTVENSDVLGSVYVASSDDTVLSHITFRWPTLAQDLTAFISGEVYLIDGTNNRVSENVIDGGWDGGLGASYQHQGCDDGVILNRQSDLVVEGNTIRNVFDAGVEPGSSNGPIRATIQNNTITNAGYTGIGGYYVAGWQNSVFRGNTVSHSPSLLYFTSSDAKGAGITAMTLVNNQFVNNTLLDPVALPPYYGGHTASVFRIDYVSAGLPATVSGNLVQSNNFGTVGLAPVLLPLAGFIDGGGNVCRSDGSLACSGVNAESGQLDIWTTGRWNPALALSRHLRTDEPMLSMPR